MDTFDYIILVALVIAFIVIARHAVRGKRSRRLFDAISSGDRNAVEEVLNRDPGVITLKHTRQFQINELMVLSCTPLALAIVNQKPDIAVLLVERGVPVNETCSGFLKQPDSTYKPHYFNFAPLHMASRRGMAEVARALIEKGADIDIRDCYQSIPLHYAAWSGSPELVALLVDRGSRVNEKDYHGVTPLHWAGFAGKKAAVETLVAHDADVNLYDSNGVTPLHWAVYSGDRATVQALLSEGAFITTLDGNRWTPLHWAAFHNRKDVIESLIAAGANVLAPDGAGCTPLDIARGEGYQEIVKILSTYAQDGDVDEEACADYQTTRSGHLKAMDSMQNHWEK